MILNNIFFSQMEKRKLHLEQNYSLWRGRFRDEENELMKTLNSSFQIDKAWTQVKS